MPRGIERMKYRTPQFKLLGAAEETILGQFGLWVELVGSDASTCTNVAPNALLVAGGCPEGEIGIALCCAQDMFICVPVDYLS